MTEPAEQNIRVAVGQGNPHRDIRRYVAAAILAGLAGVVMTIILLASQDIGWWPYVAGAFVVATAALAYAALAQAQHHDEMETALTMFATIATDNLKAAATLRGEDPAHAWETLANQIKTHLTTTKDTQ